MTFAQNTKFHYQPTKSTYGTFDYHLKIPSNFQRSSPNSPNGDFLYFDPNTGASITMIVVKRDYQTKSPHEITKSALYTALRTVDSSVAISDYEKIWVNGKPVLQHLANMKYADIPNRLNHLYFTYYDENLQYILTLSCAETDYLDYEQLYRKIGRSVKFY